MMGRPVTNAARPSAFRPIAIAAMLTLMLSAAGCGGGPKQVSAPPPPTDLLRTYEQAVLDPAIPVRMPGGFGDQLEAGTQTRFAEALSTLGYTIAPGSAQTGDEANGDDVYAVLFSLDAPPGPRAQSWRSPVQIEEQINPQGRLPTGPLLNTSDFSGPPAVTFNPGRRGAPILNQIKMRVTVRRGTQDVWTGVAFAALDGRSREGLALAMADALAGAIGQSRSLTDFRFTPVRAAITEVRGLGRTSTPQDAGDEDSVVEIAEP
ncbi:MAG: hypothetical protein AAFR69_10725 [Pseudomonadota bacterium]